MSIPWDLNIMTVLFAAGSLAAFRYYQGQADKYRDGKRNEDMDRFRGGGGSCCH